MAKNKVEYINIITQEISEIDDIFHSYVLDEWFINENIDKVVKKIKGLIEIVSDVKSIKELNKKTINILEYIETTSKEMIKLFKDKKILDLAEISKKFKTITEKNNELLKEIKKIKRDNTKDIITLGKNNIAEQNLMIENYDLLDEYGKSLFAHIMDDFKQNPLKEISENELLQYITKKYKNNETIKKSILHQLKTIEKAECVIKINNNQYRKGQLFEIQEEINITEENQQVSGYFIKPHDMTYKALKNDMYFKTYNQIKLPHKEIQGQMTGDKITINNIIRRMIEENKKENNKKIILNIQEILDKCSEWKQSQNPKSQKNKTKKYVLEIVKSLSDEGEIKSYLVPKSKKDRIEITI